MHTRHTITHINKLFTTDFTSTAGKIYNKTFTRHPIPE